MKLPVLSWIVCVLGLIGLVAWLGTGIVPVTKNKGGEALVGGPFSLTAPDGSTVTDRDLRGKYALVYFGFTHCPDICPTSLLLMQNALDQLGAKGKKVTPVFITLDPERDTPEIVGNYVSNFGDRFVGLTGTPEQIRAAADAYKVYYSKVEDENSALGYIIDHSGFMFLMDPDGKYVTHFPHSIAEQSLTEGLDAAIR
ncbi:MAG: SCO family protein [Azospirillum brasilense]|nr:MAG: SCO family protein [Azospirillum brasilense]